MNAATTLLNSDCVFVYEDHGSDRTHEVTRNAMGKLVADNIVSWVEGKGPLTPVPETPYKGRQL